MREGVGGREGQPRSSGGEGWRGEALEAGARARAGGTWGLFVSGDRASPATPNPFFGPRAEAVAEKSQNPPPAASGVMGPLVISGSARNLVIKKEKEWRPFT